jgi:hypothetical protein
MNERHSLTPEAIDAIYGADKEVTAATDTAYAQRSQYLQDLKDLSPYTAELPDQAADDVYERLRYHERRVAPNLEIEEYGNGTASFDDELLVVPSEGSIVISADHATDPVRKATGVREGADHGTAGIALLMNEVGQGSVVLPLGRQTGNANVTIDHPAKDAIRAQIEDGKRGFLSVHGMVPGRIEHQYDDREVHAMIGLGKNPNEASIEAAHALSAHVKREYGLRAEVANWKQFYSNQPNSPRLKRTDDGVIRKSTLAAFGEGTTTNYVRGLDQGDYLPAMQIELSRTLRLLPKGMEHNAARRDIRAIKMSVFLGYLLNSEAGRILTAHGR